MCGDLKGHCYHTWLAAWLRKDLLLSVRVG